MEIPESVSQILNRMRDAGAGSTADELAAAIGDHDPPVEQQQYTAAELKDLIMTEARADVLREKARADHDEEVIEASADAAEQVVEAEAEADAEVAETVIEAEAEADAEVIEATADAVEQLDDDDDPPPPPEPGGPEPTEQHWATRSFSGWKLLGG